MSDERIDPTPSTVKRLFAVSGNRCAYPECPTAMWDREHDVIYGEMAHIHGPTTGSPRHLQSLTNEECRSFENLLLLCPTHHTLIDKAIDSFTSDQLREMKATHEASATPISNIPSEIEKRFIQHFRDAQEKVQYALSFNLSKPNNSQTETPVRVFPDGKQIALSDQEKCRFLVLREIAMELGTMPPLPPLRKDHTDQFSIENRAVKIFQLMLRR